MCSVLGWTIFKMHSACLSGYDMRTTTDDIVKYNPFSNASTRETKGRRRRGKWSHKGAHATAFCVLRPRHKRVKRRRGGWGHKHLTQPICRDSKNDLHFCRTRLSLSLSLFSPDSPYFLAPCKQKDQPFMWQPAITHSMFDKRRTWYVFFMRHMLNVWIFTLHEDNHIAFYLVGAKGHNMILCIHTERRRR